MRMSLSERRRTGGSSVQLLFSPQTDPDRLTPAISPAPTHASGASHTTPTTPIAMLSVHGTTARTRAPRARTAGSGSVSVDAKAQQVGAAPLQRARPSQMVKSHSAVTVARFSPSWQR
jgi:hypothetical protein